MINIYYDYEKFISNIASKNYHLYYEKKQKGYFFFATDGIVMWSTNVVSDAEISNFEANYKSKCNKCIYDENGKTFTRAESRPLDCTTCFTTCGDIVGDNPEIGNGTRIEWDAGNLEEFVEISNTDYKKKEIYFQFCDSIWLKEGTLYYMNCEKGSYVDIEVLCPPNFYYMYMGEIQQNTSEEDLVVDHYLFKHPIQDSVPMGDELNTEACSQELPSYLKYKATITIPVTDTSSYGYLELELYRQRTIIIK